MKAEGSSMAYSPVVRLAIAILFLSISAVAARPCKSFLISTYSVSITPENVNPNSNDRDFSSTRFVTIFTIRRFSPHYFRPFLVHRRHEFLPSTVDGPLIRRVENRPQFSIPFISEKFNSYRDRSRDILSVVVALLLGVSCGALIAAAMYLVWAVVSNHHSYHSEDEEDYESEGYDDVSPKKMGYVKIPDPAPATVKEAA